MNKFNKNIKNNRYLHNKIAGKYKKIHSEIFNTSEQKRLNKTLAYILSRLDKPNPVALDYGCGSGNLTNHLLDFGCYVTAADISENFLFLINKNYKSSAFIKTELLSGDINADLKNQYFDIICIYSVLHHIPDYLGVLKGLIDKLRPGGLLFIDHEASESFWNGGNDHYKLLQQESRCARILSKIPNLIKISWYKTKLLQFFNSKYQPEGDIHVWDDDHIEWSKIDKLMQSSDMLEILSEDYLLRRSYYTSDQYSRYKDNCSDMHYSLFKKLT